MCGCYRLSRRTHLVEEYFDSTGEDDWVPRYNIAPTQPVPIIRQNPKEPRRELSLVRWGLIPSWTKDASGAARMINARSETAATLPAFRDALKSRRCLVPADGFYEWKKVGETKQPYCFEVNDGKLFAFAGLWDRWKDPSGQWIKSCSVLTTTPNAVTSSVPNAPVLWDSPHVSRRIAAQRSRFMIFGAEPEWLSRLVNKEGAQRVRSQFLRKISTRLVPGRPECLLHCHRRPKPEGMLLPTKQTVPQVTNGLVGKPEVI